MTSESGRGGGGAVGVQGTVEIRTAGILLLLPFDAKADESFQRLIVFRTVRLCVHLLTHVPHTHSSIPLIHCLHAFRLAIKKKRRDHNETRTFVLINWPTAKLERRAERAAEISWIGRLFRRLSAHLPLVFLPLVLLTGTAPRGACWRAINWPLPIQLISIGLPPVNSSLFLFCSHCRLSTQFACKHQRFDVWRPGGRRRLHPEGCGGYWISSTFRPPARRFVWRSMAVGFRTAGHSTRLTAGFRVDTRLAMGDKRTCLLSTLFIVWNDFF